MHPPVTDEFTALVEGLPLFTLVGFLFTVQLLVLDKVSAVPEGFHNNHNNAIFPNRNFPDLL